MSTNSVTWKWLAGTFLSILLLGGAGWMRMLNAEVQTVKGDQKKDREASADARGKVGIIEERTKRVEQDVQEIKEDLKELLRRTPRAPAR